MNRYINKIRHYFWRRNEFESNELRDFFNKNFGVCIGLYSYGCFDEKRFPRGTKIGRYCSFATTSIAFRRNHGVDYISTHPYLYNSSLGFIDKDTIENRELVIEDDVWVGHNVIILPSVSIIERGAVIAAGSVVTKNVSKYSIVAGNPAKVVKMRFSENIIEKIEMSKWWELDKSSLLELKKEHRDLVFNPGEFYEKNN
ncbi:antibiotic acetyltransferase [Photobacterium kishitanii]|uniref:CatB-related O-acetyltransferase n=1 Tax=Photobacterium kishitanii TaxID=318456 RepID=UPI0007EF7B74|nr:CatB-related O-acetyltransferase [Photobacterium kishitanii]OBU27815.1 hypothetical protein AYY22_16055 [Photobacterium kishitanii]PSW69991.1 antibiotic acetyltransferase [Photobacterium kishitanii]